MALQQLTENIAVFVNYRKGEEPISGVESIATVVEKIPSTRENLLAVRLEWFSEYISEELERYKLAL